MADSTDPWIQAQQQAQQAAYSMWGQLPGTTPYQADPGIVPTQLPGGGYSSGEDWARAQQAAQARSDATLGPAPGIGYKGQTGPYGAPADQPMAANYLVARPDQWAMNGSGPAVAPAMQQAVNEDPRLADVYSQAGVSRLNNVGNGYGVLPGALTPGVMSYNGSTAPKAFNQLMNYSAQNPGSPMGMDNLGPLVAQYMAANPLQAVKEGAGRPEGVNPSGEYNNRSFYDYSKPNGSTLDSRGAALAASQQQQQAGGYQGPTSAGPYTYMPSAGGGAQSMTASRPMAAAGGSPTLGKPGASAPPAAGNATALNPALQQSLMALLGGQQQGGAMAPADRSQQLGQMLLTGKPQGPQVPQSREMAPATASSGLPRMANAFQGLVR